MALEQRQQTATTFADPAFEESIPRSPRDGLARLAGLHDEAAETAMLANIVGRTPYMAAGLAILAGAAVGMNAATLFWPQTVAWLIFVAAGVCAIARAYGRASRAPFALAALTAFHGDMKAVAVYAGFGFGAGAFLVLPASTGTSMLAAFAVASGAILATIIRDRDLAIAFIAPVTVLSALAALLRPLAAGATGALSVLLAGALVGMAVLLAGRIGRRSRGYPSLAHLPLS
ncbi:MAG TPA: hypothetical protein VHW02_05380 [Rhizomicrobium sp.]|jgi:hypothetical protein|nr:hypothetical protein [Rhizomicrobium sp.]